MLNAGADGLASIMPRLQCCFRSFWPYQATALEAVGLYHADARDGIQSSDKRARYEFSTRRLLS
jgi:hypothetical protein